MNYQLKVTTPSIPMIINIELNNFKRKFTFTPQRKELFKILQDFISRFTALEKIDYHILIGGSFKKHTISNGKRTNKHWAREESGRTALGNTAMEIVLSIYGR
jgi:hypothetical protein